MPYTLGQAARVTGKSKPTVQRSIKLGRISASKDAFGNWQIEPAELHRVYPPVVTAEQQALRDPEQRVAPSDTNVLETENRRLSQQLSERERLIEDLRSERDHWREESDSWRKQAQSLLTDQTPRPTRRRWWFWLI
jgi:hypothetical protein